MLGIRENGGAIRPAFETLDERMQDELGLADRASFRERYLVPALRAGLIEMTLPDKPNSRLQGYRLTDLGRQWLTQHAEPHARSS